RQLGARALSRRCTSRNNIMISMQLPVSVTTVSRRAFQARHALRHRVSLGVRHAFDLRASPGLRHARANGALHLLRVSLRLAERLERAVAAGEEQPWWQRKHHL